METPILLEEYRGEVLENVHRGIIAVVNLDGEVIASAGNPEQLCYYRSTAKPFQAIPTIMRGLTKQYDFTKEQISILNASHWGRNHHLDTLLAIMEKTGFQEEDFIMLPFMPLWHSNHSQLTAELEPDVTNVPRKLTHDCTGKHLNLMMLQKELTGHQKDYWRMESPAQQEVLETISRFSGIEKEDIAIGTDGCGVPVFGVPLRNMAWSYARLMNAQVLGDDTLAEAVELNLDAMHTHPEKINDYHTPTCILSRNENYIAKDGARGVFCVGLKKEQLGIAIKLEDGYDTSLQALIVANVLEQLGVQDTEMIEALRQCVRTEMVNDNQVVVGHVESNFQLNQ